MAEDLMRYDLLAQSALRGVVRLALLRVERDGLPGEHHFFIAFDTRHESVELSPRLRERYRSEMTIVLQHQFWNLKVMDDRFEVELSFDNIPERVVVPFVAVKGFFDPSVQFGLQFEPSGSEASGEAEDQPAAPPESEAKAGLPVVADNTGSDRAAQETGNASNDDSKVVSLDSFRKK